MSTCETPCSSCKFYTELVSPIPGESWNRCTNIYNDIETDYPCDLNSYGYADERCNYYEEIDYGNKKKRFFVFGSIIVVIIGVIIFCI